MDEPAATQTRIILLGRFEVRRGERVLIDASWPRRKAAALLKLLALQPDRSLHREQACEALWPGQPPDAAANNLRQNLHQLRGVLNGDAAEALIVATGERLALSPDASLDMDDFRDLAGRARESGGGVDGYERALALYEGDLLPDDLYEPWTDRPRRELHDLRNRLLIEASDRYEAAGDHTTAIERLEVLLAADHGAEEAHRALMRIYAGSGQRQRALRQYEICKDVLKQELDVEPSAETVALYEEIAAGRLGNGAAEGEAADAVPVTPGQEARGSFWSRGRVRLAGLGVVVLAAGALAIGLAMDGVMGGSDGDETIEYTELSVHLVAEGIGRQVSGDCVSSDIVYQIAGGAVASGDLAGDREADYTTTFPIEFGCQLGFAEGSVAIGSPDGVSGVNYALLPLTHPVNGQPTGQSDQPGSALLVTGQGQYAGLSGTGRCNVPQTGEPISPTETRWTGEGDCFITLAPSGEQQPVLVEALTSWLQLAPAGSDGEVPDTVILSAFYMNDSDEPLDGLRLRIPQPAGASLAVAREGEEFVAAHDRSWSLPEIGPRETAQFLVNVQLIASSRDEIVVIPEIYGEGLDEPARSSPLRLRVVQ
jgi:DNA-binding SARP family transcriptional activator